MSFGVSLSQGRFEYQARALGLLAQPSNLARPSYLRMVADILRFARTAPTAQLDPTMTTRAFLDAAGYSEAFRRDFLLPILACIWSSSLDAMLEYPARSMIGFLDNHGLLDVLHRPSWRTVTGGSREYVRRITAPIRDDARLATPVVAVLRDDDGVRVVDARGGIDVFDEVVFATHADTTLQILGTAATEAGAAGPVRVHLPAQRGRCCTATRRCCRAANASGRAGTTCPTSGPATSASTSRCPTG